MRTILVETAVLLILLCGATSADEVIHNRLPYSGATVTGVKDGEVVFRLEGQAKDIAKSLAEVDRIQITGEDLFNQAEKAFREKKYPEAMIFYDRAMEGASSDWMKLLIRYRRFQARDGAGELSKAIEDWLALMDETKSSKATVAMAPANLNVKNASELRTAESVLEEKLRQARQQRDTALAAAIEPLLAKIAQGKAAAPAAAEGEGEAKPVPTGAPVDVGTVMGRRGEGIYAGRLKAAADLLRKGADAQSAQRALAMIESGMKTYSHAELPAALLIQGQAMMVLAGSSGDRRVLLVRAGLSFMKAASQYPESVEASQALLLAGRVNAALGNVTAARNAYRDTIIRYDGTEAAREAQNAMDELLA
ncbi:MAG TPA: hypothetical protein DCX07_02175, partial [Phycisphaerales bacterium]|nr:hypothetical protein [Phycisphaerales bacterium]